MKTLDNVRESLAKNIQKYRKNLNLSQQELAKAVGVKSLTTVSSWERGANAPDISIICKLCELFKITIEDLLGVSYLEYLDSVTDLDKLKKEISESEEFEKLFISLYGENEYNSFQQYCLLTADGSDKVKSYIHDLFTNPLYRSDK